MIFKLIYQLIKFFAPHFNQKILKQARLLGHQLIELETEKELRDLYRAINDGNEEEIKRLFRLLEDKVGLDDLELMRATYYWEQVLDYRAFAINPDEEPTEMMVGPDY